MKNILLVKISSMKYLFLITFFFLPFSLSAIGPENPSSLVSESIIEGKVIDEITGEGLAGVEIKLLGSDKVMYTDFDGYFTFKNISPGNYSLSADYISYKRKIITGVNPVSGSLKFDIKLKVVEKSMVQSHFSIPPKA